MFRPLLSRVHKSRELILLLLLLIPSPLYADSITAFYKTEVDAVPQGVGAFDTVLTPSFSADVGFLNIGVDLNRDGILAVNEWLIQNDAIPMLASEFGPAHPLTLSTPFDLTSLSISPGSYDAYELFGAAPIGSPSLVPLSGSVPFSAYDIGDLQDGSLAGADAGGGGSADEESSAASSDDSVGTLAILGRVRYDIPGILQGKNECAPTSAAQSLLWLKARYGDLATLPAQATLITDLKTEMKWDDVVKHGIFPNDFVPGKNAVVDKYKLPIVTTRGGAFNGTGTFDFIKQQIELGEDVEMRIQYAMGGHWVTIAGWFDDGTTKKLYFKDPLTGGNTVDEYVIDGTTIKNYKYGAGTVSFAVDESIVPEPSTVTLFAIGLFAIALVAHRESRRRRTESRASRAAL